ncbi:matrixin family metalloprotease [Patescibacteria group bacterium]|nr:matrixin family metalloprotease [Patescibacteria group bacterium]
MKKIALGILVGAVAAVLTVGVASALPQNDGIDRAKGISPAIDDEGNVVAPPDFVSPFPPQLSESELTKTVFIRYAPGFQKDKPCDYDGVCDPDEKGWCADCKGGGEEEPPTTACYGFLSGAKPKWNWVEDYVYNDGNLAVPSSDAVNTWEAPVSRDIFGDGNYTPGYEWGDYDYVNSISYGDYEEEGVIAVTAIWFRGKNIYEYDIMFDTDYFPGSGVDLDTVVLHEFGHGAGLGDLYDSTCSDNVMYGYYTGVKTTLADGDIVGIQTLYGSK